MQTGRDLVPAAVDRLAHQRRAVQVQHDALLDGQVGGAPGVLDGGLELLEINLP